jgi:pimeloyl-ACP methyl ester carboxylesterase
MHIVFLPATEPGDLTYGAAPQRIAAFPAVSIHQVRFPTMVWYNRQVRRQAVAQIRALGVPPVVLVGFSKSGLGAWNIARAIPEAVWRTIIFDAPVARAALPPWGTAPFYADDAAWQVDLPIRGVDAFRGAMPATHSLVLISGAAFHGEMLALSQALGQAGVTHTFLPRPHLAHHWGSGWIEAGLELLTQVDADSDRAGLPRAGGVPICEIPTQTPATAAPGGATAGPRPR